MHIQNQLVTTDGSDLPDRFVSRDLAAAYCGVSPRTLASWASAGCGPAFSKLSTGRSGAVRYSLGELRKFMSDPASYRPRPVAAFRPVPSKRVPIVKGPNVARSRRRRNGKAKQS